MSLVRELEAKKAIERRQLVQVIMGYLHNLGIDVFLVEATSTDRFGGAISEPVIQLNGQSINRIRLTSTEFISCGIIGSVSRFRYEILLDKKFTRKSTQQIRTKTKPIKEKKKLGLFGGRVVGINWVGRDLAELLNHDANIVEILLDCTKSLGEPEFRIQTKSPYTVEILGPRFVEPQRIMDLLAVDSKERFEKCVLGYRICDRIAKHIRELATAW